MTILSALLTGAALMLFAAPSAAALPAEFGSEGSGAGEFREPRGIAVDQESGDLYIADRNNARIEKFGPEGEFLLAFGWGVADGSAAAQTCGPGASPPSAGCRPGLEGGGAGQFESPEGLAVDNDPSSPSAGDLYVLDSRNSRIEKFTSHGEFVLAFGSEGTGPGQFERLNGRSLAVDSAGSVFVGDENRVQKFSPGGTVEAQIPIPGAGFIENLTLDSAGDLYVKGGGLAGVRKYDQSGTELGFPRDEEGNGESEAIAIGPSDELFVNDLRVGSHHIFAYDPSGAQIASFDAGGEAQDGGRGIAYSTLTEALYILNAAKVRILTPPPPGPLILAGSESATEIGTTSASLGATINPEGGEETRYEFEYGTEAGVYTESTPVTALPIDEIQALNLTATEGTFTLSFEGEVSAAIPFDAEASELQAALEAIPAIGAGNVSVSGLAGGPYAIQFTGALAEVDVAELAPDPSGLGYFGEPGSASLTTTRSGGRFLDRAVTASVNGLQPRTTYHFRVVATNKSGQTTTGPDQSFETLPPVSIDSISVSQVSANGALLETELNPHGLPSAYHFEYDTAPYAVGEAAHGTSIPFPDGSAGEGSADVQRTAALTGLATATTYHYRVVAENTLGRVESEDREFTTTAVGPALLPDGRGWELVSPPNKHGSALEAMTREGGVIQAAADGTGLAYIAKAPLETDPAGNRSFAAQQQLAHRGAGGWSSQSIVSPNESLAGLHAGELSEYRLFAADLSAGLLDPAGTTPLSPLASEPTPYRREADGEFVPLVYPGNVPDGTKFGESLLGVTVAGANPDLSHILLSSDQALVPGFETDELQALYEWTDGTLSAVSILPGGASAGTEGGVKNLTGVGGGSPQLPRHQISADGSRVFFETGAGHLYLRDLGGAGESVQLDAPEPGAAGGAGEAFYQDASEDGGVVYFSDEAQLTADSKAAEGKPDLYRCDVAALVGEESCAAQGQLSDLTVGSGGKAGDLLGAILGTSADGASAYFVANGLLTNGGVPVTGAFAGDCESPEVEAGAQSCGLYRWHEGQLQFLARLSGEDLHDWGNGGGVIELPALTSRLSPNGRFLAFMSELALTGYDNRDVHGGSRDEEVFLYDAAADGGGGKLICTSCNPSGARPEGAQQPDYGTAHPRLVDRAELWSTRWLAGAIPGWTPDIVSHAFYQARYLSNQGRLFFNSFDALAPQDTDGTVDVYQYEPPSTAQDPPAADICSESSPAFTPRAEGCLSLISSGNSGEESVFLDASEGGDDVFFLTASRLVPADFDGALDVYDAHVCTAGAPCPSPPPPSPPRCAGDACQPPALPPPHPTPGTAAVNGPGNVHRHHRHHKKKHRRRHKHAPRSGHRTAGGGRGR
jgi:DNA-binding beta-propeller fold protein YncE